MAASAVEIANRALAKLGEDRITAFSDASKQARLVNSLFAIVRQSELRTNTWSFSVTRTTLSADATPPAFGYSQRFLLPAQWLRTLMVGDLWPGSDITDYRTGPESQWWTIEGRYLLTDMAAPLKLRYIQDVEDTTQWDSAFVEAFACKLAVEMCEDLTADAGKMQMVSQQYDRAITAAARANAIEKPPKQIADDTWVTSRLRG